MEENKKVEEPIEVEVEVTELPKGQTKKGKAWGTAKKVGGYVWKAVKTTTSVVGGIVIVAFAAGTAIGAAKKGEPIPEVPIEPVKPNDNEELNTEITSEDSTLDVGLDV